MDSGYTLTCRTCEKPFTTQDVRRVYCSQSCKPRNPTRRRQRSTNDLTFVGVDGEGVDRPDGTHEYVMLSVGDRTLWADGTQLTLSAILSFLWECYVHKPDAAYVGFFLGYDFTQWEKLLPESVAYSLLTTAGIAARKSQRATRANPFPDAVVWEDWEIDIMAGRRFKMRPHVHHMSAYSGMCRNRTCRKVMEDATPDTGEPETIYDGEMDFCVPTGNGPGGVWEGTHKDYWQRVMPRMHRVGKQAHRVSAWLYICDTGPFWQTSFLNVINPKGWDDPPCDQHEFDTIKAGKDGRSRVVPYGDTGYFEEMRKYNVLENDILARVTVRLNQGFMNDAIPIKLARNEWYGPGRAAQTWMDMLHARIADKASVESNKITGKLNRTNEYGLLNADTYMSMPSWFYDAAQASYYGGWFEQFMHGHIGDVWEYDINSAYPHIIASLPCLHTTNGHDGEYRKDKDGIISEQVGNYVLVYGTVRGSNAYIGAMPYRTRKGSILRPQVTKGWYWLHEIEAAQRAGIVDHMDTESWVSYRPCTCNPPFNPHDIGIQRMYQLRLDAGKNSPQGKALKLVYNSAYGKTAQSIGTPKYANPVYASLITAGCRTLILDAIASHPLRASACAMVATDGIYFTTPHPYLELSETQLGLWDVTEKKNLTQLMPGVYWDDATRELIQAGKAPKLKSRGVNARDLANRIEQLDYEFSQSHQALSTGGEYEWPSITFPVNFLMDTAKLALQRGKWETAGRVQHGTTRSISSNPVSKRLPVAYRDRDLGVTRTRPYERGLTLESVPYTKSFGYLSQPTDGLYVDRDGSDGMQYFRDLINGNAAV